MPETSSKQLELRYYYDLERHFEASGKPSATAMMIMKKMANGEPLGPAGKPGKGSLLERQQQEAEEKEKKDKDGHPALEWPRNILAKPFISC